MAVNCQITFAQQLKAGTASGYNHTPQPPPLRDRHHLRDCHERLHGSGRKLCGLATVRALPSEPDPEFESALQHKAGVPPGDPPADTGLISTGVGTGHGSGAGSRWIILLIVFGAVLVGAMMIGIGVGVLR